MALRATSPRAPRTPKAFGGLGARPHSARHPKLRNSVDVALGDAEMPGNLGDLRALREKLESQLQGVVTTNKGKPPLTAFMPDSAPTPSSPRKRPDGSAGPRQKDQKEQHIGGIAAEDFLKKRAEATKKLSHDVESALEALDKMCFQVRKCLDELQHRRSVFRAQEALAISRAEHRAKRPASEQQSDELSAALEIERRCTSQAREKLAVHIKSGKDSLPTLGALRAEIVASRLTLHLDRSGNTQKILAKASKLEEKMQSFCSEALAANTGLLEQAEAAKTNTLTTMRAHIQQLLTTRLQMEAEIKTTCTTLADAQRQLARKEKELQRIKSSPEAKVKAGKHTNHQYDAFNAKFSETLSKLRSKIKGAAYIGSSGRQLDVLFTRFDRDNSGELDEDELRRAFRRTVKVPKSVLSDADIHSLTMMLDGDGSGSVSIREIVDFLESDVDIGEMEKECQSIRTHINMLTLAKNQATEDLRNKTLAWQIDCSCSKLSSKRLELAADGPSRTQSRTPQTR